MHDQVGFGLRIDALQAAILGAKLAHLDEWVAARNRIADRYGAGLADTELALPTVSARALHAWHLYVIRSAQRDDLLQRVQARGVGVGVHYPVPLHLQPAYAGLGYAAGSLPVTEEVARTCLSLPMYPEMTEQQIDTVVTAVRAARRRACAGAMNRLAVEPLTVTVSDDRQENRQPDLRISVVVPARNEEATIADVVQRSFDAFDELGCTGEVLVVNDGSTDGTGDVLAELVQAYPNLTVFTNRRGMGMTAALRTMFAACRGEIVTLIPGDMESDPAVDVPTLVRTLETTDLDVVAGWRQGRQDNKVFASGVYNWAMRAMAGVPVHDANWIKAMRREVVDSFPPLRSDWHRFLLMIAVHQGFSVGEVATQYKPRPSGSSKFGWERIPISFLDVLVVKFLLTFSEAPMRFFGGLGLIGNDRQPAGVCLSHRVVRRHEYAATASVYRRRSAGDYQRPAVSGGVPG